MPDEPDDLLPLLGAVRTGDEPAARALVERLHPLVLRIVRAHRPRRVAEEDLCQEVFMSVFADIGQYRAAVSFQHWVSRVAVNTCYDALRREKARPELRWADMTAAEVAVIKELLSREATTDDEAHHASELLMRLLDALPPRDRLLMQWLGIEEQSLEEVALRLGWSRVRVKVTAFRIRMRMRSKLKQLLREEPS
jgi:RNA polymerase sigma-70 factor, ECF subfamily